MPIKSILLASPIALLVGGIILVPAIADQPAAASGGTKPRQIAQQEGPSPVRCTVGMAREDSSAQYRSMQQAIGTAPQRMMAPQSPPPPPAMAALPSISVSSAPMAMRAPVYGEPGNTERYEGKEVAAIQSVAQAPVSTFSIDVDTGSYANVRRFLTQGSAVPAEAVRTEEMINYFRYDYPRPQDRAAPFSITTDVAQTPWNPQTRLLRIGLRGYDVTGAVRPAANLVFLIDVSGSMSDADKLPLVKTALTNLADQLRADDRVSIVVYAGAAGVVLSPTANKSYVKQALECLESGGSTAGAEGIELAYKTARENFRAGGINRVILATDGDFNVGISDNKQLEALVKRNRDQGITLTTLGFGEGNYNDAMMERIADVGNGNYAYIDSAREAKKVLGDELSATLVTIAKDVKVQVEFNPALVKEYRLIGYENRALSEEDFTNDAVDAGDMGAGHQVTALYEVVPAGSAGWTPQRRYPGNQSGTAAVATAAPNEAAFVKLRYKLPDGTTSRELRRPVLASAFATAPRPTGDMAFVTAVAAFGQKLRGDKYLGSYGWRDIAGLAGTTSGETREEFVKLLAMANKDRG